MPEPVLIQAKDPFGYRLSKSKYLSGLQCPKRLYLAVRSPELAAEPDEHTQVLLDMGAAVGELARRRFPGGVLVETDRRHPTEALRRTADFLRDPSVSTIFEGAFEFQGVLVRVDILERFGRAQDGSPVWRIIEVKSSTRVKDVHVDDLAIQAYVLTGAGIALTGSWLMYINTAYVYPGGELDLERLFTLQDVTGGVVARQSDLPGRLGEMKEMLVVSSPPAIEPDGHCHTPYECPFWDHCTKDKPARWVYYLPGGTRVFQQLVKQGIQTMDEIPPGFRLSSLQRHVKDDVEWVGPRLKATLQTVRYPVHHLDFETFMPAIPRFPLTRPYQMIPTQWSNHIESEDGGVRRDEYLSMEARDPREEIAWALLESIGKEGSICVYSEYERHILETLCEAVPSLEQDLRLVIARLWDLFPVIRDNYYHPQFKGSFSIKSVLPALVPSLSYDDLEIQEGSLAAQQYHRMVFEETDWVEKARIRDALLRYCERDSLGMLEIRRVLLRKALAEAN